MDWVELKKRVNYVRALAKSYGVQLPPGEGLAHALQEADGLADGAKSSLPATDENVAASAHDAHIVWALAENLKTCVDAGITLRAHLANMGTGSTDYGTPAGPDNRAIYFKDFEYELFIMAHFIRNGVAVVCAPTPNDPCYEFTANGFFVQLKHPNSKKQLRKQASKFNQCLHDRKGEGLFGAGVEDAFALGTTALAASVEDRRIASSNKAREMDAFGRDFLKQVARCDRIACVFQTSTLVYYEADDSQLQRLGNACVFDDALRKQKPSFVDAMGLGRKFNPKPVLYSEV